MKTTHTKADMKTTQKRNTHRIRTTHKQSRDTPSVCGSQRSGKQNTRDRKIRRRHSECRTQTHTVKDRGIKWRKTTNGQIRSNKQTHTHIQTWKPTNKPMKRKKQTNTNKETKKQTNKQTKKQNKQTNKQTNKQRNKQTNKQTDKHIRHIKHTSYVPK
jgi:hypothetical protein